MKFLTASLLTLVTLASAQPRKSAPTPTEASTSDDDSSSTYTSYQEQVKALIDSGNTDSVTSNSDACGSSATSYYEEFEYSGYRVLITSGVPSHEAEENLLIEDGDFNPNRRCERWQYVLLPLSPSKADSYTPSGMEPLAGLPLVVSSSTTYHPLMEAWLLSMKLTLLTHVVDTPTMGMSIITI